MLLQDSRQWENDFLIRSLNRKKVYTYISTDLVLEACILTAHYGKVCLVGMEINSASDER